MGQPKRVENAKILVANTAMDTDKVKIYGARVRVDSMARVADIEAAEKEKMAAKVGAIVGHGINCFVNRQVWCGVWGVGAGAGVWMGAGGGRGGRVERTGVRGALCGSRGGRRPFGIRHHGRAG